MRMLQQLQRIDFSLHFFFHPQFSYFVFVQYFEGHRLTESAIFSNYQMSQNKQLGHLYKIFQSTYS